MKAKKYRCSLWPECSCAYHWNNCERIFKEGWNPDQLRLDFAEIEIRNMLDCVARNCPDQQFRQHATVQLMHPVFNRRCGRSV